MINIDNVFVIKNKEQILISCNGKRLIIPTESNKQLCSLTVDQIKEWYVNKQIG